MTSRRGLRIAMFVMNTVEFDRRVLREASTLASDGHEVTVVGVRSDDRLPTLEARRDGFRIARVPLRWRPANATAHATSLGLSRVSARRAWAASLPWLVRSRARWGQWRREALRAAPRADVYHGHDLPGLGVAAAARSLRGGALIYDSHDLFVESGANAHRPRWAKAGLANAERRLYRQADHLITVNHGIADRLHEAYGPIPTSVVHNCVPRWTATPEDRRVLRAATGLGSEVSIVLYHGGFTANRGLGLLIKAMAAPVLLNAHLVLLGYGPMESELQRLARGPLVNGRVHVLPPVPPDDLDRYICGADVVAMVNQPASENEILSTPNKLFEALAAGVPVVTSDFALRREIVQDDQLGPLGALCDPTDAGSITAAIAELLHLPQADRDALRSRCLAAAHRRWNWEREQASLREAYEAVSNVAASSQLVARRRRVWYVRD